MFLFVLNVALRYEHIDATSHDNWWLSYKRFTLNPSGFRKGSHWRVNESSPKTGPWGGLGESVSTNQDTTAVYSSKSAECEYVTMTLSAKMQAQQPFFVGTNESTDAGPLLPVTSTGYSLHVYKWPQLPGYPGRCPPKKMQSCFDFWHFECFFLSEWKQTGSGWIEQESQLKLPASGSIEG